MRNILLALFACSSAGLNTAATERQEPFTLLKLLPKLNEALQEYAQFKESEHHERRLQASRPRVQKREPYNPNHSHHPYSPDEDDFPHGDPEDETKPADTDPEKPADETTEPKDDSTGEKPMDDTTKPEEPVETPPVDVDPQPIKEDPQTTPVDDSEKPSDITPQNPDIEDPTHEEPSSEPEDPPITDDLPDDTNDNDTVITEDDFPKEPVSATCTSVLMDLSNNFIKYNNTVLQIFRNSGKDYNDFGRYEDCIDAPDLNYFLLAILNKFPIPFGIGMCLPSECSQDDLNDFKPFLVKVINSALPELVSDVIGFNSTYGVVPVITSEDIHFYDSYKENAKVQDLDALSIITILIILFFCLTTLISTFILWSKAKERQDRFDQHQQRRGQRAQVRGFNDGANRGSLLSNFSSFSSDAPPIPGQPVVPPSRCTRFMRCFSVVDNLARLSRPRAKQGDQELEVLNGFRVLFLWFVIMGQTYFYTLRGPIQNLEAVQEWVRGGFFSTVLSADMIVDIFFWMSAFLASYQLLVSMKVNQGKLPNSKTMIILNRFVRLWPLYIFTLLFYWRFIVLFGGEGPMFFEYENSHTCKSHWVWHLSFLNNIVPWKDDNCMNWTWYLACEMQFFLLVPFLAQAYYNKRIHFWIMIICFWTLASVAQLFVILKFDLSPNFLTYKDQYWNSLYDKPYYRLPGYLIGVVMGCCYYSYKHEETDDEYVQSNIRRRTTEEENDPTILNSEVKPMPQNLLVALYTKINQSSVISMVFIILAFVVNMILTSILTLINKENIQINSAANVLFLLFQRPISVSSKSLGLMVLILGNKVTFPMQMFHKHSFWYPLSRLTYGAYLSAAVFMIFRMYNTEHGIWACEIDSFLYFLAYLTLSFMFSLFATTMIESPCLNLYREFVLHRKESFFSRQGYGAKKSAEEERKSQLVKEQDDGCEPLDTSFSDSPKSSFSSNNSLKKSLIEPSTMNTTINDQESLVAEVKAANRGRNNRRSGTDATLKQPSSAITQKKQAITRQASEPTQNLFSKSINVAQPVSTKPAPVPEEDDGLYFLE